MRRLLPLLLLAPALTGCLTPEPAPRLYVLDPLPSQNGVSPLAQKLTVGVAMPEVPEYLDRPELVVRTGPNEVKAVDNERWAERLPTTLARALSDNLTQLLGQQTYLAQSNRPSLPLDYEVYLNLSNLAIAGGTVTFGGYWIIFDGVSRAEVKSGTIYRRESSNGPGLSGAVEGIKRAVGAASIEIADALRRLPPKR